MTPHLGSHLLNFPQMLSPTYKQRNEDFRKLFSKLPEAERLIVGESRCPPCPGPDPELPALPSQPSPPGCWPGQPCDSGVRLSLPAASDYSCALQREILLQGRLYLSENWICFYSNIFRWETTVSRCGDMGSRRGPSTGRTVAAPDPPVLLRFPSS